MCIGSCTCERCYDDDDDDGGGGGVGGGGDDDDNDDDADDHPSPPPRPSHSHVHIESLKHIQRARRRSSVLRCSELIRVDSCEDCKGWRLSILKGLTVLNLCSMPAHLHSTPHTKAHERR